jgi:carboxyl-terminal processing protease
MISFLYHRIILKKIEMKKITLILIYLLSVRCYAQETNSYIACFGKTWGFLKYFHPQVQKGKIDWDSIFIREYPKVKQAIDKNSFNEVISDFRKALGPVKKLSRPKKYFPKDTTVFNIDYNWISRSQLLNPENIEWLTGIIENYKPRRNVYYKREYDDHRFSRINTNVKDYRRKNHIDPILDEPEAVLSLFKYWNRINYFHAYKKLMDIPWDSNLIEFIPKIINNAGSTDLYLVFASLTSRINDGHGFFSRTIVQSKIVGYSIPSIEIKKVEGKTIISNINDSLALIYNIQRGDILDSINHISVNEYRNYISPFLGGQSTSGSLDFFQNLFLISKRYNKTNTYFFTDKLGRTKEITTNFNEIKSVKESNCDSFYRIINNKYCYLKLSSIQLNNKTLRKALQNRCNYQALIIDLREYPKYSLFSIAKYLKHQKDTCFCKYYTMNEKFPGTYYHTKVIYKPGNLKFWFHLPQKKYKGDLVILVNEQTISSAEFQTMWARVACKAIIIGRATAGADGACKSFRINNYFGAAYTQDAVFWPDGKPTQRIGIIPNIIIEPTIQSAKNGVDEILNGAIKYLDSKNCN